MNDIETALAALRTSAPDTVLSAVLAAAGPEEEYALVGGPAGPMFVSWNSVGVTACVPLAVAESDEGFESGHPGEKPCGRLSPEPFLPRPARCHFAGPGQRCRTAERDH